MTESPDGGPNRNDGRNTDGSRKTGRANDVVGDRADADTRPEQDGDVNHVLSLCDRTGNMVRPWARAGYICQAVDVQHDGVTVEHIGDGAIIYIGADVREYQPPTVDYAAGFGFPPCTDLAVSGARWSQDKGLRTLADALDLVGATQETLAQLDAPWMLENPVSVLSTHWREPDYRFDPYEYANYTERDESYSKQTWLWTGGGFKMPVTDGVGEAQADDRIHKMPPSEERADRRAETPRGFARAVYLAQHDDDYARADSGTEQAEITEVQA